MPILTFPAQDKLPTAPQRGWRLSRPPLDQRFTLNRKSPQAQGLVACWNPSWDRDNAHVHNMVTERPCTLTATDLALAASHPLKPTENGLALQNLDGGAFGWESTAAEEDNVALASGPLTVAFRIWAESENWEFLTDDAGATYGWQIAFWNTGINLMACGQDIVFGGGTLAFNRWHDIVWQHKDGWSNIWANGRLLSPSPYGIWPYQAPRTGSVIKIGTSYQRLDGYLTDIRFYNTATPGFQELYSDPSTKWDLYQTVSAPFWSLPSEAPANPSGTLSKTLGSLTVSAAGTVEVEGTLAVTLGALTLASQGTVPSTEASGTLSQTLADLTKSLAGTVEVKGTATPTLAATLSAVGTAEVKGTLSSTLGATLSSAGLVLAPTYARPSGDAYDGAWTNQDGSTTDLYDSLDETVASDTDYIQSEESPVSSAVVFALSTLSDPNTGVGHVLRYRYGKNDSQDSLNLTVQLRESYVSESELGTLIASWSHTNISSTLQTAEQVLTEAQANAIGDYSSLFVRMVAS